MRRAALLTLSLALLGSSTPAAAAPKARTVVVKFKGWKAPRARAAAVRGISKAVALVPKKQVAMAAKLIDGDPTSPLGLTKLLAALDAPLAVEGTVVGEGTIAQTTIQVFASDGRRLSKWTGSAPASRADEDTISAGARSAIKDALRVLAGAPASREPSAEDNIRAVELAARNSREIRGHAYNNEAQLPEGSTGRVTSYTPAGREPALAASPAELTPSPRSAGRITSSVRGEELASSSARTPVESASRASPAERTAPRAETSVERPAALATRSDLSSGPAEKKPFAVLAQAVFEEPDEEPAAAPVLASRPAFAAPAEERTAASGRSIFVPKDELIEAPRATRTLSALAGLTVRRRLAQLSLEDGSRAKHDTGAFPELTVMARTRPFAQARDALGGVFADLEGAFAVGLATRERGAATDAGASALRLRFAAGWLYEAGAFAAGGTLGFGIESFTLASNPVIGSSAYTFVRPGILARAELFGEAFAAELDAGYRAILSTGDVGAPFGQPAQAFGLDANVRLLGALDLGPGLSYGVQLGYQTQSLSFGQPKDPTLPGPFAVEGTDSSLSATLVLGIALR